MAQTHNKNQHFSVQEAVNGGYGIHTFGAASLDRLNPVRAIHSNVTRSMKLTFVNGSSAVMALAQGAMYNYQIVNVKSAGATAISSTSALVIGIY